MAALPPPTGFPHDAASAIGDLILQPDQQPRLGQPPSNTVTHTSDARSVHSHKVHVEHVDQYHHSQHPMPQSLPGGPNSYSPYSSPHPSPSPFDTPPASILQPTPLSLSHLHSDLSLPLMTSAPVSPHLAAPPRAYCSSPTTSDNASIRGFDSMVEKHATFREGKDEVFTPFSPRARQAGPRKGPGRSALGRKSVYSTVDFWKRLSMARGGEESQWIRDRKRSIWVNPLFVVPFVLVSRGQSAS